jgi:mannosylglycoprotein endo-beta-mannosidase
MLLGFRDSSFEVGAIDRGRFFICTDIICRADRLRCRVMGIYGPADHSRSAEFLQEVTSKVNSSTVPIIMGGDFNLIRAAHDKNNDRINWSRMDLFNEHIAAWGLREIPRTGARYTWTNKQLNPVRCVLDRVFISPELELHFPLCAVAAETSLGSDHTPLVFDSGEGIPPKSNRFFFESSWLELHGFQDNLQAVWLALSNRVGGRDIVDWWSFMSTGLRQHLRVWNANKGKENRDCKQGLLSQIKSLDDKADAVGIDEEEWALRYHLEDQLLELFRAEEEYWRQRGRVRWVLQGDANSKYFHALANGRRRKCCISSFVSDQGVITDKRLI